MWVRLAIVTALTSIFWDQGPFADPFVSGKICFSKSSLGREYSLRVLRHFEENKNWVKSSPKTWTGPKLNISWGLTGLECFLPLHPHYISLLRYSAFPRSCQDVSYVLLKFCTKKEQYFVVYFGLLLRKKIPTELKGDLVLFRMLHSFLQKSKYSRNTLVIITIVYNLRK